MRLREFLEFEFWCENYRNYLDVRNDVSVIVKVSFSCNICNQCKIENNHNLNDQKRDIKNVCACCKIKTVTSYNNCNYEQDRADEKEIFCVKIYYIRFVG